MENLSPDLSVIVPVYGVERYIGPCVRSLMEQTHRNVEFIFVDDCTPDSSVEIAKEIISEYPWRQEAVRWVVHEKNRGPTAARNSGLDIAKGKYIYYCDSDDRLATDMLAKLYGEACAGDYDIVWSDFYFDNGIDLHAERTIEPVEGRIDMLKKYISFGWTVVWNMIVKRSLYQRTGIRSNESICFCEDYELTIRLLACAESWSKVAEPLYYYNRANAGSIVRTSLSMEKIRKTVSDELTACRSVYDYMGHIGLRDILIKQLSWRNLKAKRGLLYPCWDYALYSELWPEANQYIDSNPFCSNADKKYMHLARCRYATPVIRLCNLIRSLIK